MLEAKFQGSITTALAAEMESSLHLHKMVQNFTACTAVITQLSESLESLVLY